MPAQLSHSVPLFKASFHMDCLLQLYFSHYLEVIVAIMFQLCLERFVYVLMKSLMIKGKEK